MVDVDGPLNPYAAKRHQRPEGYETHRLLTPTWTVSERERLDGLGRSYRRVKPLRVWLNPSHGPALVALPYNLVWASTWEDEANTFLAPLLGLPDLPYIVWSSPRVVVDEGVFWKTPQVVSWAQGRPFAWVDDEITDVDLSWVRAHHPGPALLHRVDPQRGLASEDFAALSAWARELNSCF